MAATNRLLIQQAPTVAAVSSSSSAPPRRRYTASRHPMRILVVNAGSSSVKLQLYEQLEEGGAVKALDSKSVHNDEDPVKTIQKYAAGAGAPASASASASASAASAASSPSSASAPPIHLVCHRVVHGGALFHTPTLITPAMLHRLEELNALAPLHNPPAIAWIHAAQQAFPATHGSDTVQHVAVFDTAFFHHLPLVAQTYALPKALVEKHNIRRYGFHGIAHESMLAIINEKVQDRNTTKRLITLQLGSGCSAAAILAGRPVETSFGFGPLEGLVTSSRCGDIDPALLTFLQQHEESLRNPDALQDLLYHKSGLLGISGGESADMKKLCESKSPDAALAVDVFIHRLLKYIGAYVAVLGGLDLIAFGGGIGEHSHDIRRRVVERLAEFLPVELDSAANAKTKDSARISSEASKVQVWVIAVDEGEQMVKHAVKLTQAADGKSQL